MEICFHRNIKSVIIIINVDAAIVSHFVPVSFSFLKKKKEQFHTVRV